MSSGISENDIAGLRGVANKALKFEFYIFRKAYGSYYSVWATVIFLFVFLPYLGYLPAIVPYIPYILFTVYLITFVIAVWITRRIFRKASYIIGFKSILNGSQSKSLENRRLNILSMVFFIIAIILISFYGINNILEFLVFYSFLIIILFYLLKSLKLTFEKLPVEGIIALATYILSTAMSVFSVFALKSQFDFSLSWLPAITGWYFSAFYAKYSSRQYLEELNGS